ncbi:MAG: protein kinase [Ahniella sp.]|nr:protein kinase [Ahniella sp.]
MKPTSSMSSDPHAQLRELFDAALDLPEDQRLAFVRARAADNTTLAADVIELLGYGPESRLRTQGPWKLLAEAPAEPLAPGRRMGRYELFEPIGAGGMGQVYRARRVDDIAQWVAVKVIRPEFCAPNVLERFHAERKILARLNHPGIAHFLDADTDADGTAFVTMELVDGKPILDFARLRGLDIKAKVALFRQLLAAVGHAHGQLIIHRDIKAANVLVRDDGGVKLLDFGIAKLLDEGLEMARTRTRERLFTPLSAAPEQIRGEACDVTTDVYALGVLLYELIAGVAMFDAGDSTPGEYERLVLDVPPASMRTRRREQGLDGVIPYDLDQIVQKALRKERVLRYASVEQFDADLARFLTDEPVSVSGSGRLYRARKFVARHRLATAMAGVSLLAILAALMITIGQNRVIRAERDRASLALNVMKDAFLGADPGGLAGGEVSARQILDQSTTALQPLAKNGAAQFQDLAIVLLEVQLSMGLIQDADRTLQAMSEDSSDPRPRICLLTARVRAEQGDLEAAERELDTCGSERQLDADDRVLRTLVLGRITIRRKQYPQAVQHFETVTKALSPTDPMWVYAHQQKSHALANKGQLATALDDLSAAEQEAQRFLAEDHPNFARLKLARLEAMSASGDRKRLLSEGPEIVSVLAPRFGSESALVGRAEAMVGAGYMYEKRYAEAVPHLERSWQAFKATFGPGNRMTLRAEMNLVSAMGAADLRPNEVRTRFDNMIRLSSTRELQSFKDFASVEYSKWLARAGQNDEALRVLIGMVHEQAGLVRLNSSTLSDHQQWLNYSYWAHECASDPEEHYSAEAACKRPAKDDAVCRAAQGLLCPHASRT